jgi:hypothetical protein
MGQLLTPPNLFVPICKMVLMLPASNDGCEDYIGGKNGSA